MSVDDENFKDIEAKMKSVERKWPSALGRACLDNTIKTLGPILKVKNDERPSSITSQYKHSVSRGKE